MTEHEWFSSTDPAAMWRHVEPLATQKQKVAFTMACRRNLPVDVINEVYGTIEEPDNEHLTALMATSWAERNWSTLQHLPVEVQCAILRDIFGNPWKRYEFSDLMDYGLENDTFFLPKSWLAWNDGTIPRLARAIRGGERWIPVVAVSQEDVNSGPFTISMKGPNVEGIRKDEPPRWEDMPILADALEEAGCTESSILEHCRRQRCQHYSLELARGCSRCHGTESRNNPETQVPLHVAGCWVIELILGER